MMNRRAQTKSGHFRFVVASLVCFMIMSGCQSGTNLFQPVEEQTDSMQAHTEQHLNSQTEGSHPEHLHKGDNVRADAAPSDSQPGSDSAHDSFPSDSASASQLTEDAPVSNPNEDQTLPEQPQNSNHPAKNAEGHYAKPGQGQTQDNEKTSSNSNEAVSYNQLMGIKIGDTIPQVIRLHGDAVQQYEMADEKNPITVYVYDGFEVGFNSSQQVEFVDVFAPHVDPGLNGIRIHQTVEEAIAALGTPSVNTHFVLNYISDGIVLKMDIDPRQNIINSVKLFALN